jgi:hypothetical protein
VVRALTVQCKYKCFGRTCGSSRYSTSCACVELGSAVHILRVPPLNKPSVRFSVRWTSRPNVFSFRRCIESFVGDGGSVRIDPPPPSSSVRASLFDTECTWTTSYSGTTNVKLPLYDTSTKFYIILRHFVCPEDIEYEPTTTFVSMRGILIVNMRR